MATPPRNAVGEQFRRVAANREILRNLERIAEAGARVHLSVRSTSATRRRPDAD